MTLGLLIEQNQKADERAMFYSLDPIKEIVYRRIADWLATHISYGKEKEKTKGSSCVLAIDLSNCHFYFMVLTIDIHQKTGTEPQPLSYYWRHNGTENYKLIN